MSSFWRQAMPMPASLPAGLELRWKATLSEDGRLKIIKKNGLDSLYAAEPLESLANLKDLSLMIVPNMEDEAVVYLDLARVKGSEAAFYVSCTGSLEHEQGTYRGLSAYLRMEALKFVSQRGGTLEPGDSISAKAQSFWQKLHKSPDVITTPRPKITDRPDGLVIRNKMDSGEPPSGAPAPGAPRRKIEKLPPDKHPELYQRYRVGEANGGRLGLVRVAGRLEVPKAILDLVWGSFVEDVAQKIEAAPTNTRDEHSDVREFPLELFVKHSPYKAQMERAFRLTRRQTDAQPQFKVYVREARPTDKESGLFFNTRFRIDVYVQNVSQARITLEHELIHLHQYLLMIGTGSDAGGPGKNLKVVPHTSPYGFGYALDEKGRRQNVWGRPVEATDSEVLKHEQRDIEFYTNLNNEVKEFVRSRERSPYRRWMTLKEAINDWLRERPRFNRQKANPARYRKMVREFTRAVMRELGGTGYDKIKDKEPGTVLQTQYERQAYAEAVKSVDSRQVLNLMIAVYATFKEEREMRGIEFKDWVMTVDPSAVDLYASNDYGIYKEHVEKLPVWRWVDNKEHINTADAVAEVQRRLRAVAEKTSGGRAQ